MRNGLETIEYEMTPSQCDDVMRNGAWNYPYKPEIRLQLKPNQLFSSSIFIKGNIDPAGSCTGGDYLYKGNSMSSVVVTQFVRIMIQTVESKVDLPSSSVNILGVTCSLSKTSCFDVSFGIATWSLNMPDSCSTKNFIVLFKGQAKRSVLRDELMDNNFQVYTIKQDKTLFSLRLIKKDTSCFDSMWTTDQEGILILKSSVLQFSSETNPDIIKLNIHLGSYINTKFVYLENHIKDQLEGLYPGIKK